MSTKWEMLDRKSGLPSRNHINRCRRSKDLYWNDRGIIQETICEPQEIHQQPSLLWDLKKKKQDFTINWSILKRVAPRAAGRNTCNLCLEEKLSILESSSARLLNKRSELFSNFRHRFKFSARNFKRTRN